MDRGSVDVDVSPHFEERSAPLLSFHSRFISVNFHPLHFVLEFSNFQLKDCRPLRSLQSSTDFYRSILVVWLGPRAKAVTQRTFDTLKETLTISRKQ